MQTDSKCLVCQLQSSQFGQKRERIHRLLLYHIMYGSGLFGFLQIKRLQSMTKFAFIPSVFTPGRNFHFCLKCYFIIFELMHMC